MFAQYFIEKSYLAPISTSQVVIFNVTFEPGCRNNWHIHHAKSGGGQILICVAGRGFYQEEGEEAIEMKTGLLKNFKTVYCESPCEIRQCALNKGVMTCDDCADIGTCQALSEIISNTPDVLKI